MVDVAVSSLRAAEDAMADCTVAAAAMHYKVAAAAYLATYHQTNDTSMLFDAAVCLYLASDYPGAVVTGSRLLADPKWKEQAADLVETARRRSLSSYWDTLHGDLMDMLALGRHKDVIDLLVNHPTLLPSFDLAQQLAESCERTGLLEAAEGFRERCRRLIHAA